jgi:hypothetical protein
MAIVVGVTSGTSIGNYSGLIQYIIDTLKDETLEEFIPTMIRYAEALFDRELYPLNDEVTATITTTADVGVSALPEDFKKLRALYKGTDTKVVLPQLSVDDLKKRYLEDSNGQPVAYALGTEADEDSGFHWGPIPDDEYEFSCVYVQGLTNLSQTQQTNWLIEWHPDLYYFGTLMYAELFGWNDERSAFFGESAREILAQVKRWDSFRRRGERVDSVAAVYF